ncbi:MAG: hypothetical protein JNM84_24920 [Planctomycetes bacterium]|nr:hypothetical protein [Planctomycetota bacterium]
MHRRLYFLQLLCLFSVLGAGAARAQDNEFWKEFQPAIRLADMDTMIKLTRKLPVQAVETFLIKVEQKLALGVVPEELETEIKYLKDAYTRAVGDELLFNYEKLLGGMSAEQRQARRKAEYDLRGSTFQKLGRLQAAPDPAAYPALLQEFGERVKALEDLGDHYWASEGYYWYARATDESRKSDAGGTLEEALALYKKAKELRRGFGVNDAVIRDCDKAIEALEKENTPAPGAGTPGEATGPKFAANSKWLKLDLEPAPVDKPETIVWPGHLSDDRVPDWVAFSAGAIGEKKPISWFPGKTKTDGPLVLRESATKYMLDMDQDGTYDGEFKMGGKPVFFEVQRVVGGQKQPYWFWVGFGSSQEQVQGLGVNMAPNDKFANMYFRCGMSRTGKLVDAEAGIDLDVAFFDENLSGEIGDDRVYNLRGTQRGETTLPCPLYDSMIIGKGRRAVPFSSLVVLEGQVYRLKFGDEKQNDVRLRRLEMGVGRAQIEVDGLKLPLASYIVEGDGDAKGAYFDLAADKKGVELPVGKYKLATATFRSGKGAQIHKLAATNGDMPPFEVKPGETVSLKIGKPFTFDFEAKDTGPAVEIKGNSIVVRGVAGEIYFRYQGLMIQPDVNSRKKGSNQKPGKGEAMKLCDDETFSKNQDAAWAPLDYVFAKPGGKGEFELHLSQKGHKWFGNIDSEWRPK